MNARKIYFKMCYEESMGVTQRILKREVSFRHVKGKEETSVELLEEILSNQSKYESSL